jgi:hypothetical protein
MFIVDLGGTLHLVAAVHGFCGRFLFPIRSSEESNGLFIARFVVLSLVITDLLSLL